MTVGTDLVVVTHRPIGAVAHACARAAVISGATAAVVRWRSDHHAREIELAGLVRRALVLMRAVAFDAVKTAHVTNLVLRGAVAVVHARLDRLTDARHADAVSAAVRGVVAGER